MRPVKQAQRHDPENGVIGDCFRACICSLLEIDINAAPNFVEDPDWPEQLYSFLTRYGCILEWNETGPPEGTEYYIVQGTSPRGVNHSVIYKDGKLAHDPHPDGGGVTDPFAYLWLANKAAAGQKEGMR